MTQFRIFRNRVFLRILYSLISILIIVTLFGIFGLKPLLSKRIKDAVSTSTNRLYSIDFDDIEYQILAGRATIENVRLKADSSLFDNLKKQEKLPNNVISGQVNNILLTGLNPISIIFSKKLHLNKIDISDPNIQILHEKLDYNEKLVSKTPYQIISKFVNSFSVEKILLNNINLKYTNLDKANKTTTYNIERLDLELSNLLIDSLSHKDTSRFFYTENSKIKLKKLEIPSSDSLNNLQLNSLEFSTNEKKLSIENFSFIPAFKPLEYGNKSNGDDRIEVAVDKISITNIDLEKLLNEKKIYAKNITFDKGHLDVFSDERPFSRVPKSSIRLYPHQAFMKLKLKCLIEEIRVKNFDISFAQFNPETNQSGKLYFSNTSGIIKNVTNDTIPLSHSSACHANFTTYFMKNTRVKVDFGFNLKADNGEFTAVGNVSKMALTDLNQTTNALVKVKVESGVLDDFRFNLKGNMYGVSGSSTLLFHDLKIQLLKEKEESNVLKKRKFLSFLTNKAIVKDSNPAKNKPPKIGIINYQRNPTKGFFAVLWQSILSGIKSTMI